MTNAIREKMHQKRKNARKKLKGISPHITTSNYSVDAGFAGAESVL
jgi:hypothetical protein